MLNTLSTLRQFLVTLGLIVVVTSNSYGQLGGRNAFGFTSMAFEPHVSSLGGMVLGQTTTSMSGMDFPSALQSGQNEVNIGYTSLYGSSSAFAVQYIIPHKRLGVLQVGTRYLTHGLLDRRDPLNTYQGKFSANEVIITGNKSHLTNIAINLLDNALKYCDHKPEITVETFNDDHQLHVKISDNGFGMSPTVQKRVFDKFYRASSGDIHNVKGHGLGLSYVKKIIDLHKGAIKLESKVNQGTTFQLIFPLD